MKQTAILLYRAAVLIEKSERLYLWKSQMEHVVRMAVREHLQCWVVAAEVKRCEEEIELLWWEVREIEHMVPNTARYAA